MPEPSSLTAKGEATRQRILDAATVEFASHGLAGARVDRIAAAARANKAQIYAHFGSKDELFDAAFSASMRRILADAPIDPDDLADWAVRLYDDYLARPDLIRLAAWQRLERRPRGYLVEEGDRLDEAKIRGIAGAQAAGRLRTGEPFDILALVIAMSVAWSPTSGVWAASRDDPEADHDARRRLLRAAVAAAVSPDRPA